MTFTEAAAQVLRLVGKPLHYKEITDVAIEKNLLSHVGKSPEVTMGARLAALVKKNEKENPLVRVRPGVFALRDWDQNTIDAGLLDRTPALERIATLGADGQSVDKGEASQLLSAHPATAAGASAFALREDEDDDAVQPDADERRRAEFAAEATAIFAREEDDDEPIFGPEQSVREDEPREGSRRRRRRRRGRSSDLEATSDLPSYTVSDAPAALSNEVAEFGGVREADAEVTTRPGSAEAVELREAATPREDRERHGRGRPTLEPSQELTGRPLADAVFEVLVECDPKRGPVAFQWLAEALQRRGYTNGDTRVQPGFIAAALRVDELRTSAEGSRSRFRIVGGKVAPTDWSFDQALTRAEKDLAPLLERYRDAARKAILRSIQDLPHRAVGEITMLALEREGISGLRPVRRQGSHPAELHLAGAAEAGALPVAIVVRRDGREVGRERVTELRGALHHYHRAVAGWIVTTGQVLSGAREEAAAQAAAPVTLIDGMALARLCEEHAIGVLYRVLRVPVPDAQLFESLRTN